MAKCNYTKTLYFSTICCIECQGKKTKRFVRSKIWVSANFFFCEGSRILGVIHLCRLEKSKCLHYTSYHVVSIIYSWNLQNHMHAAANLKILFLIKKSVFFLYIFVFVMNYIIHYTLLIIYIHESTPSFLKRPLPTFNKFKLFVANNPLRVVASFFPLSKLKSSIPFFSRKIVPIFRRFWQKIVLRRESLRLLYALKLDSRQKNMRPQ